MAHCLKIVEIQNLIIEHLEAGCSTTDPPNVEYFATLASLARTSSIFTEAAFDALWREQPSLAYLIQVMPDDLWTIAIGPELRSGTGGVTKTVETLKFNRPLKDTDWSRFGYYSHRVRGLGYMSFHRPPPSVDESVFESFKSHRPFHSLLPNLYAFHLDLADPSTLTCLPFIPAVLLPSCAKLTELVLNIPHKLPDDLPSLLSSISDTCIDIRVLKVRLVGGSMEKFLAPPSHRLMLIQFVCGLNNLQSLLIPGDWNVTPDLIDHLGNLTGLQRCEEILIDSTMASLQLRQLFTTDGGRFSKLRHLSLQTSTPEQAADVIQSLQLPLEHLSIDSWRFDSDAESFSSVQRLMESFVNHKCISSLTTLRLYVSDSLHETSPDSLYDFTSLFLLKALRELYLHWETNSPFDNDWLADAAMAWPHLSSLILDSLYHETPVVTLAGLVPLIRHCPQLSHLSLTLDAKPFGRGQDDLLAGICNRRITSLVVPYSLITDPEGVFQCLQLMFPCLTSIDYQISYETDQEGDWDRLVELLPPNNTKQRRDQSLKDLRDMQFLDIDEEMIQAFANLF